MIALQQKQKETGIFDPKLPSFKPKFAQKNGRYRLKIDFSKIGGASNAAKCAAFAAKQAQPLIYFKSRRRPRRSGCDGDDEDEDSLGDDGVHDNLEEHETTAKADAQDIKDAKTWNEIAEMFENVEKKHNYNSAQGKRMTKVKNK